MKIKTAVSRAASLCLLSAMVGMAASAPGVGADAGVHASTPVPRMEGTLPGSAPQASKPASGVEVLKLVICKGLDGRDPQDPVTTAKLGDSVVGWSQIRSENGDTNITHRWQLDGKTVADVPLAVKGSPYRTWSRKTLSEAGNWSLQVLNSDGQVLQETSVSVSAN